MPNLQNSSFQNTMYDTEALDNYYNQTTSPFNYKTNNTSEPRDYQEIGCTLPNNRSVAPLKNLITEENLLRRLATGNNTKRILGDVEPYTKPPYELKQEVPLRYKNNCSDEAKTNGLVTRHERISNPPGNLRGIENGFDTSDFLCENVQHTFWTADSKLKCNINTLTQLSAKDTYHSDVYEHNTDWDKIQETLEKNNNCCVINGQLHTLPESNNNKSWGRTGCGN